MSWKLFGNQYILYIYKKICKIVGYIYKHVIDHNYKYIFIVIFLLVRGIYIYGADMVYAQASTTSSVTADAGDELLINFQLLVYIFGKFFSWFWVIPANLAGKFMTNEFVYGVGLGMDGYLWRTHLLIRNIAYMAIVLVLLKYIGESIQGKPEKLQSGLIKLLFAGLAVSSSRWIMGALLDISNIATTGIGALATNITSLDNASTTRIANSIQINMSSDKNNQHNALISIICDSKRVSVTADATKDKPISFYSPKSENMAGPLVYFGAGLLNLPNFAINGWGAEDISSVCNGSDATSYSAEATKEDALAQDKAISTRISNLKNMTIGNIVSIFTQLMFMVPIIVLLVVNFIRIVFLRAIIVMSPLIVLIKVFDSELGKLKEEATVPSSIGSGSILDISNIIGLIFQPVVTMTCMVIAMYLLTGIFSAMTDIPSTQMNSMYASGAITDIFKSTASIDVGVGGSAIGGGSNSVSILGSVMADPAGLMSSTFGYIVMVIMTIFMLWTILKISSQTATLTAGVSKQLYKTFSDSFWKNAPSPFVFNGKRASLGAVFGPTDTYNPNNLFNKAESIWTENWKSESGIHKDEATQVFSRYLGVDNIWFQKSGDKYVLPKITDSSVSKNIGTFIAKSKEKFTNIANDINQFRTKSDKNVAELYKSKTFVDNLTNWLNGGGLGLIYAGLRGDQKASFKTNFGKKLFGNESDKVFDNFKPTAEYGKGESLKLKDIDSSMTQMLLKEKSHVAGFVEMMINRGTDKTNIFKSQLENSGSANHKDTDSWGISDVILGNMDGRAPEEKK